MFVVGAAAEPDGYETLAVEGDDPAEARRRRSPACASGSPTSPSTSWSTSSEAAAYAMPAAGWAARSGDPVLFVGRDGIPEATVEALRRNDGVPVYVLGPESAIERARR